MVRRKVRLDRSGIAAWLESTEMHRLIQEVAEEVVENIQEAGVKVGDRNDGRHERDLPVDFLMTTTDRAHAVITIAHPSGDAVQAKHGLLTKAAADAGLEFKARRG